MYICIILNLTLMFSFQKLNLLHKLLILWSKDVYILHLWNKTIYSSMMWCDEITFY